MRIWKIAGGAYLYITYWDGMKFWLNPEGSAVWAKWPETSSLEDAATFLLGPVLGFLLRLRGITCLHASAVVLDGRAVAFVGDAGAGKSTTAAAFARRGHPVLSDDVVALVEREGAFHVLPAYGYLSLWADSVTMLYGPEKKLPSFSSNWDKRMLSFAEDGLRWVIGAGGLSASELSAFETTLGLPAIHRAQAGLIADLDHVADVLYGRAAKREAAA